MKTTNNENESKDEHKINPRIICKINKKSKFNTNKLKW